MTVTYEEIKTETSELILRINEDGSKSFIPKTEDNSDYQAYLRWLNGEEENGTIS